MFDCDCWVLDAVNYAPSLSSFSPNNRFLHHVFHFATSALRYFLPSNARTANVVIKTNATFLEKKKRLPLATALKSFRAKNFRSVEQTDNSPADNAFSFFLFRCQRIFSKDEPIVRQSRLHGATLRKRMKCLEEGIAELWRKFAISVLNLTCYIFKNNSHHQLKIFNQINSRNTLELLCCSASLVVCCRQLLFFLTSALSVPTQKLKMKHEFSILL